MFLQVVIGQFATLFKMDGDTLKFVGTDADLTDAKGYDTKKKSMSGWVAARWQNLDGTWSMTYTKVTVKNVSKATS